MTNRGDEAAGDSARAATNAAELPNDEMSDEQATEHLMSAHGPEWTREYIEGWWDTLRLPAAMVHKFAHLHGAVHSDNRLNPGE